jgi:hypothetical protein
MKYLLTFLILILLPLNFLNAQEEPTSTATTSLGELMNNRVEQTRGASGIAAPSVGTIIAYLISGALALLAIIFLILVVIAGYRWMTAAGNEEIITKSKQSMKEAIIGLIIVLAAYAIVAFVFGNLPFDIGEPADGELIID